MALGCPPSMFLTTGGASPQEMKDGTEQVLVGLSTISGAVIVGALVTTFFPSRSGRSEADPSIGLFEGTLVPLIIISALVTAVASMVALYENEQISSHLIMEIAWPLVFAIVLLGVLAIGSRVTISRRNASTAVITATVVVLILAIGLVIDDHLSGGAFWYFVCLAVLGAAAVAWVSPRLDAWAARGSERSRREAVITRWSACQERAELELKIAVPGAIGSGLQIRCWTRNGRILLDESSAWMMKERIDARWQEACDAQLELPPSDRLITEVSTRRPIRRPQVKQLHIRVAQRGSAKPSLIVVDLDDGFFDITDTGLI